MNIFKFLLTFFIITSMALSEETKVPSPDKKPESPQVFPPPIITSHQIKVPGNVIKYNAETGYLTLRDEFGKAKGNIFFTSYTKGEVIDITTRPITFVFNGGPGSSSVWLHMGCIGPKRVLMNDDGTSKAPPYKYIDNEYSWIDKTDLVFIDPINTGFSRAVEGEEAKQFLGYSEDIQSVGDFIRLFTSKYDRWGSPKFLAGESYGTTRSAGLSAYLQDTYNLYINGISLISSVLNFQTLLFNRGNDLPNVLFLPSFCATAFFHKKLSTDLQSNFEKTMKEVEEFAINDYALALLKGDDLQKTDKQKIVEILSKFMGVSKEFISNCNLRPDIFRFTKELMRNDNLTIGRLDSRITGVDFDNAGENFEFDPSLDATISGPFSASFNHYIKSELKYENEIPYLILSNRVHPWSYSNVQNQYLNVAETLRTAMAKNSFLKVWVSSGYFDLATPYFATEYTFSHMGLNPDQKKNVSFTYYKAGHMMYIHKESLLKFKEDADKFYDNTLKQIN